MSQITPFLQFERGVKSPPRGCLLIVHSPSRIRMCVNFYFLFFEKSLLKLFTHPRVALGTCQIWVALRSLFHSKHISQLDLKKIHVFRETIYIGNC